ncbi:hypothetical protein SAMN05660462_02389 [Proteiniborus ethanoligenes]|uniref:Uncharacterized protein n=1 Tax=Proteiniborus ethanoligenes TaxID=415015 RepID=A0A1H3RID9_9FIRM|nr:hypothetical protein SAMN05660462_02389 [Proteiniborus ethanoligenes]
MDNNRRRTKYRERFTFLSIGWWIMHIALLFLVFYLIRRF